MNEHIHEIPCDSCAHNRVCTVKKCFIETEIKTTHPYIKVTLECTEYMRIVPNPRKLDAPCKAESEIHCNCTKEEISKSFIEDVEAVKDLLPRTESEDVE